MKLRDLFRRWRADRMAFRCEQVLLEDGTPFGERMAPWQREDFAALDSGATRHAYFERPRGHSKTFDLAVEAATDLMLGGQNLLLYCCAADRDQALLLFNDVANILTRNPLLAPSVSITKQEIAVRATGSRMVALASDVSGSYGLRPDRVYVDEIAEWPSDGLWTPLWSATGKRRDCRVCVISTAGFDQDSIGWRVREIARSESDWLFSGRGQCASWIRPEWLEQQRRTLPAHVFARLHEARWVDNVGAFLTAEEVGAVFGEVPAGQGRVAIGLDIGLTRDRTVAAVVRAVEGVVCVESLISWQGRPGAKVDLEEVEREVKALANRFHAPVHIDPFQGVLLMQRLQRQGVKVCEYGFTGESRRKLFSVILDLVRGRRLRSRPHADLRRELLGLEATESAAGWRVDHRPGKHDDHVVAVALAAQAVAGQRRSVNVVEFLEKQDEARSREVSDTEIRARHWASFETKWSGPAPWDLD